MTEVAEVFSIGCESPGFSYDDLCFLYSFFLFLSFHALILFVCKSNLKISFKTEDETSSVPHERNLLNTESSEWKLSKYSKYAAHVNENKHIVNQFLLTLSAILDYVYSLIVAHYEIDFGIMEFFARIRPCFFFDLTCDESVPVLCKSSFFFT